MEATSVVEVKVGWIKPSPFQTRSFPRKDPELRELSKSIKAVGVLVPILVRSVADGRFELLAGERRLRASKLAKLDTIPAIVRDVDDNTAAEICVTENLQREDLGVIEEGHAVALLLDRPDWTVETVAAQIGRSPSWVARRASLWTRLDDGWKKIATDVDHPAHDWPAARLEIIARVGPEAQSDILAKHKSTTSWLWRLGSGDVLREVEQHTRTLGSAPWKLDDAELVAEAGACVDCPHRASRAHLLFDGIKPNAKPTVDRCLETHCWYAKTLAHFRATLAAATEKHGKPPVLIGSNYGNDLANKLDAKKTLASWEISTPKARPFKNSMPVLIVDPHHASYGRLMYAKKTSSRASGQRKTIAEKRNDLAVTRHKDAAAAIVGAIRNAKPPRAKLIWALHAIVDLADTFQHTDAEDIDILAELDAATDNAANLNKLAARLWLASTIDDIESKTRYFWRAEDGATNVAILTAIAADIGVDAKPLVEEAIANNPEPAAWSKKKTKKKAAKKKAKKKTAKKRVTKKRAKKAEPVDDVADAAAALGLNEADLRNAVDVVGEKRKKGAKS